MKTKFSMIAAAAAVLGSGLLGAATVEVRPAEAAVMSRVARFNDPLEDCLQTCYANYDNQMGRCGRIAAQYGNSSLEYEFCEMDASRSFSGCYDACVLWYGGA